jgi:hypothetical protein
LTVHDTDFTFRDKDKFAMIDLIRAACLTHYAETARSVGLDPAKMLSAAVPNRRRHPD